jgi:hypothetical protein
VEYVGSFPHRSVQRIHRTGHGTEIVLLTSAPPPLSVGKRIQTFALFPSLFINCPLLSIDYSGLLGYGTEYRYEVFFSEEYTACIFRFEV